MIKWKCMNCGNEFESDNEDYMYDEFLGHCENCFDLMDFLKKI